MKLQPMDNLRGVGCGDEGCSDQSCHSLELDFCVRIASASAVTLKERL